MNQIVSHIEFLLHKHNCVIVPQLGGFVVNTIPPQPDGIGTFRAPQHEIVFNPDLSHNDGLLSELYMKIYDITFDKATLRIKHDVDALKQELRENKQADLGKLGKLRLNENEQFVYVPSDFVRPDNYGLATATLKPIIQIQPSLSRQDSEKKAIGARIRFTATAAAVVALLLLLFPMDNPSTQQRAQLIANDAPRIEKKLAVNTAIGNNADNSVQATPATGQEPEQQPTESADLTQNQPVEPTTIDGVAYGSKYYIVVGVYKVEKVASQMMELLRSEGFANAGSHIRSGRTDVYAHSFDSEEEAQTFLRKLHREFTNHQDAWILKR